MHVRAPSLEHVMGALTTSTAATVFLPGNDVDPSFQYDPQKSWRDNLIAFDRSKIMYQLQKHPLKQELTGRAAEIRKQEGREVAVATSVNGWPVVLWGSPLRMDVIVGRIDENRELRFIQDIGGIAGGTIIDMEGHYRRSWNGVKFNYDFKYLFDVGIYTYLEQLLHIATECDTGVHAKLVGFAGSKTKPEINYRLLLSRGMHVYTLFERDISVEEEQQRLTAFWEMGKKCWGDAFHVYDLGNRDRPGVPEILKHIQRLEGVSTLPFMGYK